MGTMGPGSPALSQVADKLRQLEDAVSTWNPETAPFPDWPTHVTPESERRKRLCWFVDGDGEVHCYDLHARFTPGAGRIHFRLAPERTTGRIIVAHVGPKIPD